MVGTVCTTSAITVDDLDGMQCIQLFYGNVAQNGTMQVTLVGTFEKTGTNTLVLHNFKGYYDLDLTLNGNTLTFLCNDRNYTYEYTATDGDNKYLTMYKTQLSGINSTAVNGLDAYPYTIVKTNTSFSANYSDTHVDGYKGFIFNNGSASSLGIAIEEYQDGNSTALDEWVFSRIGLIPIDCAQTETDYYNDGTVETGNVKASVENSTVSIENFWGSGVFYRNTMVDNKNTIIIALIPQHYNLTLFISS